MTFSTKNCQFHYLAQKNGPKTGLNPAPSLTSYSRESQFLIQIHCDVTQTHYFCSYILKETRALLKLSRKYATP